MPAPSATSHTTFGSRTVRRGRRTVLAVVMLAALSWPTRPAPAKESDGAAAFVVVVHPNNPRASGSADYVTNLFLKRTTRWENGEHVRPVDLKPTSTVRERFSKGVLKRSVAAVRSYWQQRIFSGRALPPPELDSDEEVMRYVSKHPGAIGYVGAGVALKAVKRFQVR